MVPYNERAAIAIVAARKNIFLKAYL